MDSGTEEAVNGSTVPRKKRLSVGASPKVVLPSTDRSPAMLVELWAVLPLKIRS